MLGNRPPDGHTLPRLRGHPHHDTPQPPPSARKVPQPPTSTRSSAAPPPPPAPRRCSSPRARCGTARRPPPRPKRRSARGHEVQHRPRCARITREVVGVGWCAGRARARRAPAEQRPEELPDPRRRRRRGLLQDGVGARARRRPASKRLLAMARCEFMAALGEPSSQRCRYVGEVPVDRGERVARLFVATSSRRSRAPGCAAASGVKVEVLTRRWWEEDSDIGITEHEGRR